MKLLLAALLLLPAYARADDEEKPAEETQAPPQETPAAEPSAPAAHPFSARPLGGAGIGRDREDARQKKVYAPVHGGAAGAADPVVAAIGEKQVVKTTVYQSWKDVPPWKGNRGKWLADFGAGPGTAFSVGFKAEGGDGTFAFVEDINSTSACWYTAWISAKPGALPLPEAAANPHKPCGMLETQWTGGQLQWKTKDRQAWHCPVKEGGRYYFNFMLKKWDKSNGTYACIEHVTPQGSSTSQILRQ